MINQSSRVLDAPIIEIYLLLTPPPFHSNTQPGSLFIFYSTFEIQYIALVDVWIFWNYKL